MKEQPTGPETKVFACHQTAAVTVDSSMDPPKIGVESFEKADWSDCKESVSFTYHLDGSSGVGVIVHLTTTTFLRFESGGPNDHVWKLAPGESVKVNALEPGSAIVYIYPDDGDPLSAPPTDGAVSVIMIDP